MAVDLSTYSDGSHHHRWEGGKRPEYALVNDPATGGSIYREILLERCEFCHLGRRTMMVRETSYVGAEVEFDREDVQWAENALIHSIKLSPAENTSSGTAAPTAVRPSPVMPHRSPGVGTTTEPQEQR